MSDRKDGPSSLPIVQVYHTSEQHLQPLLQTGEGAVSGSIQGKRERKDINESAACGHQKKSSFEDRLETFMNWPLTAGQTPTAMALEGFTFTGLQDYVQCFECGLPVGGWAEADDVAIKHMTICPECPFMAKRHNRKVDIVDVWSYSCKSASKEDEISFTQISTNFSEADSIIIENELLKQKLRCCECRVCARDTLFLPCGRTNYCHTCAEDFGFCPICQKKIFGKILVEFACSK